MVMAGGQRRLEVLLELRDRFTAGIRTAAGETEGFLSALKKATPALLAISGAAAAVGGAALKLGSDLEQARGRAVSTFGDAASIIQEFAATSAESFGLSQRAASEYAAAMGNILNASGLAGDASARASVEIVKLASDLAAFNNIPVGEALDKLQAGLTGAERPLRELGIFMSEDAVQAAALRLGIARAGDELSEGQKIQARYAILVAEGSKAQGSFAESSNTVAAQMQIARAQLEDTAASLGTALLPAISKALEGVNFLIKGFAELPQGVQLAGLGILGAAGALAALGVVVPRIIEGVRLLARVINTELVVAFVRLLAPVAAVAATFMIAKSTGEALLNAMDNLLLGTNKETDAWKLMQRDVDFLDHKLQDLVGSVFKSVGASGEATQAASKLSNEYKNLLGDLSGLGGGFKKVSDEVVANFEHITDLDRKLIDLQDTTRNAAFIQEHIAETFRKAQEQAAIYEGVASLAAESVWDLRTSTVAATKTARELIEAFEDFGPTIAAVRDPVRNLGDSFFEAGENVDIFRSLTAMARAELDAFKVAGEQAVVGIAAGMKVLLGEITSVNQGIANVKLPGGQTVGGFATIAPFPWEFRSVAPPGAIVGPPPSFEKGGVVPGPVGAPMPIIAHGGETVVPADAPGSKVYEIHFYAPIYGFADFEQQVARTMRNIEARGY